VLSVYFAHGLFTQCYVFCSRNRHGVLLALPAVEMSQQEVSRCLDQPDYALLSSMKYAQSFNVVKLVNVYCFSSWCSSCSAQFVHC